MPVPRLGFIGLGWIGGLRLDALCTSGHGTAVALCDPDPTKLDGARAAHPAAACFHSADALLEEARELALDGVVIATPNALHAQQALHALERGLPVFVQKPLGRSAAEVSAILKRARQADRLVAVDHGYRELDALQALAEQVASGVLGKVFLIEAEFHNAYGPDKAWCLDARQAGGGAMLDLGVHLIDLALQLVPDGDISHVRGWTRQLKDAPGIDGFGVADFRRGDVHVRAVASWHAHTGRDCAFRVTVHGADAAAEVRNIDGSFYDFERVTRRGRSETIEGQEGRAWMDRGIIAWAKAIATDACWEPSAMRYLDVARVIDRVYGRDDVVMPVPPRLPVTARSSSADENVKSGRGAQR